MTVAATAASVAAISSLAAYINAKYHIGQDLKTLKFKKGAEKHYAELGMCGTVLVFGRLSRNLDCCEVFENRFHCLLAIRGTRHRVIMWSGFHHNTTQRDIGLDTC